MGKLVVAGATLKCSMGSSTSALGVLPDDKAAGENQAVATIQDYEPGVNVKPFGLCTSPSNPQVAAAKSPQPCLPVVTSPWTPGSPSVNLANEPALTDGSKCSCQWGGTIEVGEAGQGSANTA